MSNLYSPTTVDACLEHDGHGPVPGIKDTQNNWNTAGNLNRVIWVDSSLLATFAKLYDEPNTPHIEARLAAIHARELTTALRRLARSSASLGDLGDDVGFTFGWDETAAQKQGNRSP